MSSGDTMLKSKHSSSPHIQQELISLRTRWHQFRQQVVDTRQLIDLSLQYFTLVEEVQYYFTGNYTKVILLLSKLPPSVIVVQLHNLGPTRCACRCVLVIAGCPLVIIVSFVHSFFQNFV